MRIAICDDESNFREQLYFFLENYYRTLDLLIETFSSGEMFLKKYSLNPNNYDLIFMDIEMGSLDGIAAAKRLRTLNKDVFVIFLTSHVELATEGYEVDAFRFLTKPINQKKLIKALQDAQNEWNRDRKLLIKNFDKELLIKYKDIVYFEAQNVNMLIRTMTENFVIRKTLTQIEQEVEDPAFYRTHRSYVINLAYVADYDMKTITMETGEKIPLSRNKLAEFKACLMLYIRNCGR